MRCARDSIEESGESGERSHRAISLQRLIAVVRSEGEARFFEHGLDHAELLVQIIWINVAKAIL